MSALDATTAGGGGARFVSSLWALDTAGVRPRPAAHPQRQGRERSPVHPRGRPAVPVRPTGPPGRARRRRGRRPDLAVAAARHRRGSAPRRRPPRRGGGVRGRPHRRHRRRARADPARLRRRAGRRRGHRGPPRRQGPGDPVRGRPGPVLGPRPGRGGPPVVRATPSPDAEPGGDADAAWSLRDLTGHVGHALDHAAPDLAPDGSTVVTAWEVPEAGGDVRSTVVAIDVATGARRTLADDDDHLFGSPRVSPDGRTVALVREGRTTPTTPPTSEVVIVPLAGGPVRIADRRLGRLARAPAVDDRRRRADRAGRPPRPGRRCSASPSTSPPRRSGSPPTTARTPTSRRSRTARWSRCATPGTPHRHRSSSVRTARWRNCRPGRPPVAAPRASRGGRRHGRGRHGRCGRGWPCRPGRRPPSPRRCALGARRPAVVVELLVVAVEPVAARRPRLRGAAARPRPVHRLRRRIRSARGWGRGAARRTPTR